MNVTENYGLQKPDDSILVSPDPFNENADVIDALLKTLSDGQEDYQAELAAVMSSLSLPAGSSLADVLQYIIDNSGSDMPAVIPISMGGTGATTQAAAYNALTHMGGGDAQGLDLNTITQPGFYGVSGGSTNKPTGAAAGNMLVLPYRLTGGIYPIQLFFDHKSYEVIDVWVRINQGGNDNWKSWNKLASQADLTAKATLLKGTATLPFSSWTNQVSSNGYYYKDVAIAGLLATDMPKVGIVKTGTNAASDALIQDAWNCIAMAESMAGVIRFKARTLPLVNVPFQWEVTR
ncbi:MAG: pyocin knob domain-containing protein [Oscillospiraceae bacterium]|nr:pyocin knob domain-containing protein [Oscillospiraceae bacterium]